MTRLRLGADEVHLWRIALDGGGEREARLLSAQERERAARFLRERHRRRFAAAHVGLRRALAPYFDCGPAELEFGTGERDKPFLVDGGGLEFNLTHSGELAMVAVTRAGLVGVDVEVERTLSDMPLLVERNFAPEEARALFARPDAEQMPAFLRTWTRKEAFLKAWGSGLAGGLSSFAVSTEPGTVRLLRNDDPARARLSWTLWDVEAGPGAAAAVAVACEGERPLLQLVEQGQA